jgi:aspartyl-tRNA(Asn)/glutamyl-tRNA(Gln) amidotransferase subunit A
MQQIIRGEHPMLRMGARKIAAAVNASKIDAVDVTEAFIARIEKANPTLNALVRFEPDTARREAGDIRRRQTSGESMPLAGVPVIVKDNVWVGGRRIAQGSRLFADHVAPVDAIGVARLRKAGAVIIGIGNSPEFACKGVTNSPFHGTTLHPLDDRLTPGGSSGGNAAALAADFAPIALGTDGGGSGRRPPAHTGTVGFKPSFGAIPYGPGFPEPFWGIAVLAPMGRTVSDVALLFDAIAGPHPRDPESISIEPSAPADAARGRIAFSPRLGLGIPVDPDVANAIEAGIGALIDAGWPIERADPRWPDGFSEAAVMPMQAAGLVALQGEAFEKNPDAFDPDIRAQIERGLRLTGGEVAAALEASQRIKRIVGAFFQDHDLLLCPTAPCVAWPHTRLGPERIAGVEVGPRGHAVFTPLFNHGLVPAISIPCGQGRDGLPVGLQIIGRRGQDRRVLAAAAVAETHLARLNDYPRCRA